MIPELHKRQVWSAERSALDFGDFVAILDERNERGDYPLGRIMSLRRSRVDNFPRACDLEVRGKILSRPVTKLVPLVRKEPGDPGAPLEP